MSTSDKVASYTKDRRKETGYGKITAINRKKEEGPREQRALAMANTPGNKDASI